MGDADRFSIYVKMCHYPPGASKWNPIEHRMFCYISNNWAAHPLTDYETVLKFIRTTKTCTGLKIRASLHTKQYQKGIRICDKISLSSENTDLVVERKSLKNNLSKLTVNNFAFQKSWICVRVRKKIFTKKGLKDINGAVGKLRRWEDEKDRQRTREDG
jgi:hypothetical protein